MRRKANALSAGPCLTVNVPQPLLTAIALGAERRATTLSGYVRAAALEALRRDGVPIETVVRAGSVDRGSSASRPAV
jgi:hypothetical protein